MARSVDEIFHQKNIRGSSNGRTTVFGAVYLGSNPGPRAIKIALSFDRAIFILWAQDTNRLL